MPTAHLRRSFIWRVLDAAGASYAEINDAAVAADFGAPDAEAKAAKSMGLADLSPLARIGFKGNGALEWARGHGVKIGQANNMATRQAGGALAARLADSEVVVIDGLAGKGTLPHRLGAEWTMDNARGGYLVNRQGVNFWFMATGGHAAAMFAKICGVDLRADKFAPRAIAQTSVARTNCIVIRDDLGEVPAFHMMGDSASAEYQWTCVIDAMAEFAGQPIGLTAIRTLAGL